MLAGAGAAPAAEVALVDGRVATLRDAAGTSRDRARIEFRDELPQLANPLCDSGREATVTLATSATSYREIVLPCGGWTSTRAGFAYRDPSAAHGGVTSVRYERSRLQIELRGGAYQAIAGPLQALEVGFEIGEDDYCGRFSVFRRNDATAVVAAGPTSACQIIAAEDLLGSSRGGTAMWRFCQGKSDETPVPVDPRSLVQPGVNEGRAVHFNTWWKNCHVDPEAVQEVGPAETCGELRARFYRGGLLLDPGSPNAGGLFTGTTPGNGSSTITAQQYNSIWQVWGGYMSRPENFDELVAERYGSGFSASPNPYPLPGEDPNQTDGGSGQLPEMFTQLRDDRSGTWSGEITVTCHACHSGSVGGEGGPGPGLTWGGGSSLADLNLFLRDFLALGYEASSAVILNLNRTRGRNNASLVNLAFAMAGFQGPEVMAGVLTSGSTADMDTPAWWNMGHRAVKFVDGVFPMDAPRIDAIFYAPSIGITEQGRAWMRENGPDMNVWVESLESPPYPFPVDIELAARGAVLFHTLDMWAPERNNPVRRPEGNGSCASCHGAYSPRYVNDPAFLETPQLEGIAAYVVPLDIIGTDPERVNANNDSVQEAGKTSFFSYPETVGTDQDCGPQNRPELRGDREPGYLAPPLYGIWASAPYFHNGSVPNVWEVLKPSDRHQIWRRVSKPRPVEQQDCLTCSTVMGYDTDLTRAYDARKLGWKYEPIPCQPESATNPSASPYVNCNPDEESQQDPLAEQVLAQFYSNVLLGWNLVSVPPLTEVQMEDRKNYNTRMFAQGNEGHEFNSVLTDEERVAIIEYLKTL